MREREYLSPADDGDAHVLSRFFRSDGDDTRETISGSSADDTDLNLARLVDELGEEGGESKDKPTDEEVSVADRVFTLTYRFLMQLRTEFARGHGGAESNGVFCSALSGFYEIEETGNTFNTIKAAAIKIAEAIACKILEEDEVQDIEVDRVQRLACIADFDADVRRKIESHTGPLRESLAGLMTGMDSHSAPRGAVCAKRVNNGRRSAFADV